jgi:hypothetical protein
MKGKLMMLITYFLYCKSLPFKKPTLKRGTPPRTPRPFGCFLAALPDLTGFENLSGLHPGRNSVFLNSCG